jgi:hypothetical protein
VQGGFLQFNVNYGEVWFADRNGNGHIEITLPWKGNLVRLGADQGRRSILGTTASIANIDLAYRGAGTGDNTPVPEPAPSFLSALAGPDMPEQNQKEN